MLERQCSYLTLLLISHFLCECKIGKRALIQC